MSKKNESHEDVEIESIGDEKPSATEELEKQLEAAKKDHLYLAAEFDNFKRQSLKERSELLRYGGERLARDLMGVIDNFERALSVEPTPENAASFRQGIEMTANELKNCLQKFGIVEVESLGKPFDPSLHEAIGSEETTEVEAGHVAHVFKKGFKMHDRLIRPGQVIVAKAPKEQ